MIGWTRDQQATRPASHANRSRLAKQKKSRLQQRGWIAAKWGTSDNNRRAKFYSITRSGTRRLADEVEEWNRLTDVMQRVLTADPETKVAIEGTR